MKTKNEILQELKLALPKIQENVSLKNYTTYKIGGPAKYFFIANTKESLVKALKLAKNLHLPVFILGGGSNVLISGKGYNGLVIKISNFKFQVSNCNVYTDAGVELTKLAYVAAEAGLSGLEWAAGVPGTIGGAIYGHAQAFDVKISDIIKNVEALDIETLRFKNFTKEHCDFSLKNSIFKKNKSLVIVSAILKFKKDSAEQIKKRIKEFLEYRRVHHPMNLPSAGSTFVNPEVKIKNKKLLEKYPELKSFMDKGAIPSGYLIQKSGLMGKTVGNAQISTKHANFFVNLGGAKASDVLKLIKLAKQKVKKTFSIDLQTEIQLIGF